MVASFMAKIAVFALASQVGAVTVSRGKDLMRHEPREEEALAEMSAGHAAMMLADNPVTPSGTTPGTNDWCDDDFPLGVAQTHNCADPNTEQKLDRAECLQAMVQAGAHYQNNDTNKFDIGSTFYDQFPMGCFKLTQAQTTEATPPCGWNDMCYFYNDCTGSQCGDGSTITSTGDPTPVCKRVKVVYGTENTSDCNAAGYDNIKDEDTCNKLTGCMSATIGNPFPANSGNASKYHIYPKWCFIDHAGIAHFNTPLVPDDGTVAFPMPSNPIGKPVCNVTTVGGSAADTPAPTTS